MIKFELAMFDRMECMFLKSIFMNIVRPCIGLILITLKYIIQEPILRVLSKRSNSDDKYRKI